MNKEELEVTPLTGDELMDIIDPEIINKPTRRGGISRQELEKIRREQNALHKNKK